MGRPLQNSAERYGLLANGSSGQWDVAIDESREREKEWYAEIENPNIYLCFRLRDLDAVSEALAFLQDQSRQSDTLVIGKLGSASVSLVRDNEESPRCFVVVGPTARSTCRLSVVGEEIKHLAEALEQAVKDLQ